MGKRHGRKRPLTVNSTWALARARSLLTYAMVCGLLGWLEVSHRVITPKFRRQGVAVVGHRSAAWAHSLRTKLNYNLGTICRDLFALPTTAMVNIQGYMPRQGPRSCMATGLRQLCMQRVATHVSCGHRMSSRSAVGCKAYHGRLQKPASAIAKRQIAEDKCQD